MKRAARSHSEERSIGLGLYIVDRIVAAHGGRISVSSSEEEGTSFSVYLPHCPRSDVFQGPESPEPPVQP